MNLSELFNLLNCCRTLVKYIEVEKFARAPRGPAPVAQQKKKNFVTSQKKQRVICDVQRLIQVCLFLVINFVITTMNDLIDSIV